MSSSQETREFLLSVPSPLLKQVEALIEVPTNKWVTWDDVAMSAIHYIISCNNNNSDEFQRDIKASIGRMGLNVSGIEYFVIVNIGMPESDALNELHSALPEIGPLDSMLLGGTQMLADKLSERQK